MKQSASAKPMGKREVVEKMADLTEMPKAQVSLFFDMLGTLAKEQLAGPGVFVIPGLVRINKMHKPAVEGGKTVKNPFKPGQMMVTKAKPAKNVIKVKATKNLKDMAV